MSAVVRRARPALGTLVEMRVEGLREPDALNAIDAAFAEVANVHRLMSFHEPQSDLARVHRARVGEAVELDARTAEVLRCALQIAERSGGVFDPAVAARAVARGDLPWPDSPFVPNALASWRDIDWLDARRISLRQPLWLDFGGIAKGYAVDRAVDTLVRAGATQACVNAGGDLRIAGERAEIVTLRIARCDAEHAIELRDGAVASSAASSLFADDHLGQQMKYSDCVREPLKTVASEENLRDAGAQEPECTVEYMRIPSTAGAQIIERSRFLEVPVGVSVAAPRCMLADALTKVVLLADAKIAAATLAYYGAQALIHTREGGRELALAA